VCNISNKDCEALHGEDALPKFRRWIKECMFENTNELNDLNFVDECGFIFTLGKSYVVSEEDMGEIKEKNISRQHMNNIR
jgi:hypothetical protein